MQSNSCCSDRRPSLTLLTLLCYFKLTGIANKCIVQRDVYLLSGFISSPIPKTRGRHASVICIRNQVYAGTIASTKCTTEVGARPSPSHANPTCSDDTLKGLRHPRIDMGKYPSRGRKDYSNVRVTGLGRARRLSLTSMPSIEGEWENER